MHAGLALRQPGRRVLPALLLLAGLVHPTAPAAAAAAPDDAVRPRNVVLMIPDGCGPAVVGLARMVTDRPLALDSLLTGGIRTRSASSRVTDSAAGGSAMATGVRVANGELGTDPDGLPLGNLLEAAAARGLATGVVTTASVTDATPAAFTVHLADRHRDDDIAAQQVALRPDVLLGGGTRRFLPAGAGGTRADGRDLLAEARRGGAEVVRTRADLAAATRTPLLGLFADDALDLELDRDPTVQPSLVEMTDAALRLLAARTGAAGPGFLLVLEGAHPDDAEHDHDGAAAAREVEAFDTTVAAVLDFARRDGRTLVLIAPDHETGGLALGRGDGEGGARDLRPEVLRRAQTSLWRMADSILAGTEPLGVARRGTGQADLTPAESKALRRAHDRGALLAALGEIENRRARIGWTTGWHTAVDVGLWAWGPGRDRFRGLIDNTDVARRVADLLDLDLAAATARLRSAPRR